MPGPDCSCRLKASFDLIAGFYRPEYLYSLGELSLAELDTEVNRWCEEIKEPGAHSLRFLKRAFNADTDQVAGFETMSMAVVRLYWDSPEARRQKEAFAPKGRAKRS